MRGHFSQIGKKGEGDFSQQAIILTSGSQLLGGVEKFEQDKNRRDFEYRRWNFCCLDACGEKVDSVE